MARERVSDAKALMRMTSAIVSSAKSCLESGFTPSKFVSCLLRDFGRSKRSSVFSWRRLGLSVSHVFMKAHGCCTMYLPQNNEPLKLQMKRRTKRRINIRPPKPMLFSHLQPQKHVDSHSLVKEKSNTEKIVETMLTILSRNKRDKLVVVLENLVLNKISFAQTVENLFALSFLVKDGRAEITVNEHGSHIVLMKTPPRAASVSTEKVEYNHFVFPFDFKDWKIMNDIVPVGKELMHHSIVRTEIPKT